MNHDQLSLALREARSGLALVDAVGRYFSAHELFYGHGTDSPADEAFWLVWHLSGQPDELDPLPDDTELADRIAAMARRRVLERLPLAYLLGSAWFAGLEFAVNASVLVPRSPIAELIEQQFQPWADLQDGDRILEIGTGSGCIAIATAAYNPGVMVDATDIDSASLIVAADNVQRHQLADRVHLIEADLYPPGESRYRVIISNPPYVPAEDVVQLPAEYGHEPAPALDGGADGLDIVRRILAGAAARLADDGVLIVEVGLVAEALEQAFPQLPLTWVEFERGGEGVFLLTADELRHGW